jgi:hypothetical protein
METAIGNLVSSVFGVVLGSFIWAVILQFAVRLVQKYKVKYWDAYMTVLLPAILNYVLTFILFGAIAAGTRSLVMDPIILVLILLSMLSAYFFIQVGFVSYRIKIPFGRACLVTLAYVTGIIIFAVAIFLISWLLSILYINLVR